MGAAAKKDEAKTTEVVAVPFAYAVAKDGAVIQLVKGDVIDAGRFRGDSLEHLRSIGFVSNCK